jgi:hypothetical protein
VTCFISGEECEFSGNCELTGCEIDAARCPHSPDGKHHYGPADTEYDPPGDLDECYYCGETERLIL